MSRFWLYYSIACIVASLAGFSAVMAFTPESLFEEDRFWARTVATYVYHDDTTSIDQLEEGWASPDKNGTWSNRKRSTLLIGLQSELREDVELEFAFTPFLVRGNRSQTVLVSVNDRPVAIWKLEGGMRRKVTALEVKQEIWSAKHPKTIAFEFKNPKSPAQIGYGSGTDPLGFQLSSLVVRKAR